MVLQKVNLFVSSGQHLLQLDNLVNYLLLVHIDHVDILVATNDLIEPVEVARRRRGDRRVLHGRAGTDPLDMV